jgi:Glyoxalase/Bleomycin resistance protein/Dioxygenase superfamily
MTNVKVSGLSYVIYQTNDLALMQSFLEDFGLTVVKNTGTKLYMKGLSNDPFIHVAELSDKNKYIGAGFLVDTVDQLKELAKQNSVEISKSDYPGVDQVLRMVMPDGFVIEVIANPASNHSGNEDFGNINTPYKKHRKNRSVRVEPGRKDVVRLGHFVLHVTDHASSVAWVNKNLGLIPSDFLAVPETETIIGTFMRVDKGAEYVDHHCLFIVQANNVGAHHCSFEMRGLDDLMTAHDFLISKNYQLDCGVGRHMLGSQIFDYWKDPFGFRVEHYIDGDVVNNEYVPEIFSGHADDTTQWGARPDPEFFSA